MQEFEEMESLESRVQKLKEQREALRAKAHRACHVEILNTGSGSGLFSLDVRCQGGGTRGGLWQRSNFCHYK